MLKKKSLSAMLGIIAATSAFAGAMGDKSTEFSRGVYVEANVGYAYHPWQYDRTTTVGLENELGVLTNLSNINSGVTAGVDLGYQLTRYASIEGGWFYLPTASYNRIRTVTLPVGQSTFTLPEGLQVNINSGLGYAGFKGQIPVYRGIEAFGKIGAAYVYNSANVDVPASQVSSATAYTTSHSNYWNPLFAVGLQYAAMQNITFNVQYTYVAGFRSASTDNFIAPDINLVTVGLGYKFFT